METSNSVNYSENFTPTVNVSQQNHQVTAEFKHDFGQKANFGPSFVPHESESKDSHFGRLFNNRRQIRSVAGGLCLMINSGIHIGQCIWLSGFVGVWAGFWSLGFSIFMMMAWSVGAFIGGFVGSLLMPMLRKNFIYVSFQTGGIVIIGDIVILVWDDKSESIATTYLLMGVAHGIGYVTLITHAGENAAKDMRGTILSIVNCMLCTGIFLSVVITEVLSSNRIIALVSFILAILTIAGAAMTVETVPFLLRSNCPENAKFNFKQLRGSTHKRLSLTREMEEFHSMIVQDKQNSWNIFTDRNGKPLMLMSLMRLTVAMTNNNLVNIFTISATLQVFDIHQNRPVLLAVVSPRLDKSIVQIFYADVLKRKIQIIISSMFAGITLIIIGIVQTTSSGQSWTVTVAIAVLWLFFQLSCSMGMDQMQDVYLSEAFSTAKKQWSLPFVTGIEHIFHIFMILMFFTGIRSLAHLYAVIFVTGIVVLVIGITLVLVLPETRNMTLKQAKDSFLNYSINISSPFA